MYAGMELKAAHDVSAMIYPPNISSFFYDNNHQIVTNFVSALFNTQVKALKHDGFIFTLRNFMLASLLQHNGALKGIPR